MRKYQITFECPECNSLIVHDCFDATDSDVVQVPWDHASQTEFNCDECDKSFYTGDFEYYDEDEV